MGGAARTRGNVTPVASANLFNDPESAAIVYRSGAPLVQVGLDVCRQTIISPAQLARIQQAPGPACDLLSRATRHNWIGALAGIVPFVVVLYFFFQNVNRLLPAAL